eukprot:m.257551 g.257551  ORF g.257551 m.257551 type:complete len:602 (+) comp20962_c0_seq1:1-1806(+)
MELRVAKLQLGPRKPLHTARAGAGIGAGAPSEPASAVLATPAPTSAPLPAVRAPARAVVAAPRAARPPSKVPHRVGAPRAAVAIPRLLPAELGSGGNAPGPTPALRPSNGVRHVAPTRTPKAAQPLAAPAGRDRSVLAPSTRTSADATLATSGVLHSPAPWQPPAADDIALYEARQRCCERDAKGLALLDEYVERAGQKVQFGLGCLPPPAVTFAEGVLQWSLAPGWMQRVACVSNSQDDRLFQYSVESAGKVYMADTLRACMQYPPLDDARGLFRSEFPMFLMRGDAIAGLSVIPCHEDALAAGLLVQVDRFVPFETGERRSHTERDADGAPQFHFATDEVKRFRLIVLADGSVLPPWTHVEFISHCWNRPAAAVPHPDDEQGSKLAILKAIIRPDWYVMLDYWSFPQRVFEHQGACIRSLSSYLVRANSMTVVVTEQAQRERYFTRGWCCYEMLAALCPVAIEARRDIGLDFLSSNNLEVTNYVYRRCCVTIKMFMGGASAPLSIRTIVERLLNPADANFTVETDRVFVMARCAAIGNAFVRAQLTGPGTPRPHPSSPDAPRYRVEFTGMDEDDITAVLQRLGYQLPTGAEDFLQAQGE